MKSGNWWAALFFSICTALLLMEPVSAERIANFQVDIKVNRDGLLNVVETINYDFEGSRRHGIFRRIPVLYRRNGRPYEIHLDFRSVTDQNGQPRPFQTRYMSGIESVKIGDPMQLISGRQTYRISYDVRKAVNFIAGVPEVYWNSVGNEWPCAVDHVQVTVHGPAGMNLSTLRTASYIGNVGSRAHASCKAGRDAIIFSGSGLKAGQDLSVVVGFPKGSIVLPSAWMDAYQSLLHWKVGLLIPSVTATLLFMLWMFYGRDEGRLQAISVEWNPPKDLTPAEVGTLIDEKCDNFNITSTVLDLAARGYIRIRQIPFNGILGLDNKDYEFRKTLGKPEDRDLKPHERLLLSSFFASDSVTYLSALTGTFKDHMESMRNIIYDGLVADNYFARNPRDDRDYFLIIGGVVLAVGALLLLASFIGGESYKHYGFGIGLSGLLILASSGIMPKRTAKGVQALQQVLAFERFVRKAEKERLALLAKDDPTIFGRLLPYAVVLGLSHRWADAFKDLIAEQPDWYVVGGSSSNDPFDSNSFTFDLCRGLNTMNSSFGASPLPSNTVNMYTSSGGGSGYGGGAGGGFSGFGGGGFSGGGFGGGGGGSW